MKRFPLFALLAAAAVVLAAAQDASAWGRMQCRWGYAPAYSYPPSYYSAPLYTPAAPQAVTVGAYNDYFEPKMLTIAPGTTVRWENRGKHDHTVTSNDNLFDSKNLAPGQVYTATFVHPGTYHYFCRYHAKEGMRGTIVVGAGGPTGAGRGY